MRFINELNPPKNKKELRSFLRMINYLRTFFPNAAELNAILQSLSSENTGYQWTADNDTTLQGIKERVVTASILTIFDPKQPIDIFVDHCMALVD